jgi:endonuclease/exonuclease/phosphatase family metal-dependent hydrolase
VAHFTVASLNVRWGYDTANRPFDLVAACRTLDADVIALQEVWEPDGEPGQARLAAEELGYESFEVPLSGSNVRIEPRITRKPHLIDGWWGLVLLSRLPMSQPQAVDLGRRGGVVDLAHRRVLTAEVDVDGQPVAVTVVHLSFVLPNTLAQLLRLRRVVAHGRPQVVAGDFNLPRSAVGPAFEGWQSTEPRPTFPARQPRVQLDHVLARGGVQITRSTVLPSVGSDHLPVRAELSVDASAPFPAPG